MGRYDDEKAGSNNIRNGAYHLSEDSESVNVGVARRFFFLDPPSLAECPISLSARHFVP